MTRLFVLWLLVGGISLGCTVPVFRFALDRWPTDPFQLAAPRGWDESEKAGALRQFLETSGNGLEIVPLEEGEAEARLVIPGEDEFVAWSGDPGELSESLFLSPMRETIARDLLAGESMVWVMVASGDPEKDKAFEARMQARLDYLGSVAAIPVQDPTDPDSKLGPGPELRVGFALRRVEHKDPEEAVLVRMLAGADNELLENGEPFAAVVFGRGRVLGAWPASRLDDEGVDEVSLFLLGACSCRVKALNPGWDLVMAIDWEERLLQAQMETDEATGSTPAAKLATTVPAPVARIPEVVSFGDGGETGGIAREDSGRMLEQWVIAGLAVLAGLVALSGVCLRKGN